MQGDSKHLLLAHLFDKPCFLGLLAIKVITVIYPKKEEGNNCFVLIICFLFTFGWLSPMKWLYENRCFPLGDNINPYPKLFLLHKEGHHLLSSWLHQTLWFALPMSCNRVGLG